MDFPRPSVSPSNLIGDLKDRFGFGGGKQQQNYDEEPYYDDYNEYGYNDDPYAVEDGYTSQADPYDRLEYTTRSTAAHPYRSSGYASSPRLVSNDDIRATTSAYGVSTAATSPTAAFDSSAYSDTELRAGDSVRDSYASSSADDIESEQYDVPATAYTDFVSPYKDQARQSSFSSYASTSSSANPSTAASSVAGASRSAGLDSLFAPSTGQASSGSDVQGSGVSATSASSVSASAASNLSREITLLQPIAYDDVASVARSVRLGNIVVLSLRSTDSALAKRVLDFSFGVASALDAKVDCVADKTFVIVQGRDLSLEERHRLQKQGILQR